MTNLDCNQNNIFINLEIIEEEKLYLFFLKSKKKKKLNFDEATWHLIQKILDKKAHVYQLMQALCISIKENSISILTLIIYNSILNFGVYPKNKKVNGKNNLISQKELLKKLIYEKEKKEKIK